MNTAGVRPFKYQRGDESATVGRVSQYWPSTLRGYVVAAVVSTTVLLVLFRVTRFIPFGFLALVTFLVSVLLTLYAVWERFQAWLGWTQQEQ